jgi:hypothetical protein
VLGIPDDHIVPFRIGHELAELVNVKLLPVGIHQKNPVHRSGVSPAPQMLLRIPCLVVAQQAYLGVGAVQYLGGKASTRFR